VSKNNTEQIHIKITAVQKRKLTKHAKALGLNLSAWARLVLVAATKSSKIAT